MPALGKPVAQPFNPDNYALPNAISLWFAPFDSKGAQQEFFELGDVADLEVDLTETFVERKTARQGVLSTAKRMISDQAGAINFSIAELVGTNLELLFRPTEIKVRDGVSNAEAVLYDQTRPRLVGVVASDIAASIALEAGPAGVLFNRALTILSVTSPDRRTTYLDTTDYTITPAVEGISSKQTITFISATAIVTDKLTLVNADGTTEDIEIGVHLTVGATAAELRSKFAAAINAYSAEYVAEATGVADLVVAHKDLDGATAADITVTGAALIVDVGAATLPFAAGTATSPATIARVATGAIPDGAEIAVKFSYLRKGTEYRLQGGKVLEGALRLQVMSTAGPQGFYDFPRVSLGINGAISINPEEFATASISATILASGSGVRGTYTQLCTFADFFIEGAAASCPAPAIA